MAVITNDGLESRAYSRKEADDTFVGKDIFIEELQEASRRASDCERGLREEAARSIAEDGKFDSNFDDLWRGYDPAEDYDRERNAPGEDSLLAVLFDNYRLPVPPEETVFEGLRPDGVSTVFTLPDDFDYNSAALAVKNGILLALDDYSLSEEAETGRVYIHFAEAPDTDDKIQILYIKKAAEISRRQIKTYQISPSLNIQLYPMPADTDYSYPIKVFMNGVFLDDDVDYQISPVQGSIVFIPVMDGEDEILIHYLSVIDAGMGTGAEN